MKPVTTLMIPADGRTATGLHTDAFPLDALGRQHMERASTIEFNETTQQWEVRLPPRFGPLVYVLFTNASRERCLDWEREFFTQ
jgi:hypothetical protein